MIAICKDSPQESSDWQSGFVALLPEIQQRLRHAFRHRGADARDEAISDGTIYCLLSYLRLFKQGRAESITSSNLVYYAAKRVRSGRVAGCRLNSKEPLSKYAQLRRRIRIEPLPTDNLCDRNWIDTMVQDHRSSVLDHVAARLDVAAWLGSLCRRTRRIAADLARGCTTTEVASKNGVTAGRISQLRQELRTSWCEFQHEPVLAR